MFIKLTDFVTKVYAQNNGGIGGSNTGRSLKLSDFEFLKLFGTGGDKTTFSVILGQIIALVLTIAALTAFIYLLIAGFQYITAGGDSAKVDGARKGITNALIGIIIIMISYLLLRFVGTELIGNR
ncbi:hypothetical protein HY844_02230 [Candidatus Berkelbacteria bacterium]|nr:hypothetical protein [Candidatus Berkelbacteria bacterium]